MTVDGSYLRVCLEKLGITGLLIACVLAARPVGAAADRTLTVCTQNLWNYGTPEAVRRLRRPGDSLESVRSRIARQEDALASRLSGCDLIAVQELVGDDGEARRGLERMALVLGQRSGHPYEARLADTHDVIRNGFLIRKDGRFHELEFLGRHSGDRLPSVRGFPRGAWDRGPAEIVVAVDGAQGAGARLRVIGAHLKSKIQGDRFVDPSGEHWERLRVLQARALLDLARRRMEEHGDETIVIAGDLNNDRGSATRAVLSGRLLPADLVSPKDCIGPSGDLLCPLTLRPSVLVDLADVDPDLRGRGSYRFQGREELIDGIFVSQSGLPLAREPGAGAEDYDVRLDGRIGSGSDHRLLRVTLHY